jgi:hypothetical protein
MLTKMCKDSRGWGCWLRVPRNPLTLFHWNWKDVVLFVGQIV